MAAWSGAVPVGAPAKQRAVPHTAGIARRQRPASVGESSACLSVISGTTKCPMSGELEALNMIRQCRNLDWLILTKRPQNILKMLPPDWGPQGWSHVWLGATVENMTEARRRIPILLRVPARVHWLSVAPLLEPLDLRPWLGRGVDWIVVGGETGAKDARYMEPDWARDLRDQCQRHRCRALSQADVEAASDPCRSDGSGISGALIGRSAATVGTSIG